jgi:hypothetical protein
MLSVSKRENNLVVTTALSIVAALAVLFLKWTPEPLASAVSSLAFAVAFACHVGTTKVQLGAFCLLFTAFLSIVYHSNPTDEFVGIDILGAAISATYVGHSLYPSLLWTPGAVFAVVWWFVAADLIPFHVLVGLVVATVLCKAIQKRSQKLAWAVAAFVWGKHLEDQLDCHSIDHLMTARALSLVLSYLSEDA